MSPGASPTSGLGWIARPAARADVSDEGNGSQTVGAGAVIGPDRQFGAGAWARCSGGACADLQGQQMKLLPSSHATRRDWLRSSSAVCDARSAPFLLPVPASPGPSFLS